MTSWLLKNLLSHSLVKEILRKASATLAIRALGAASGFLFTSLISRNYGADGLGAYALSYSTLTLLVTILIMGVDISLVKYTSIYFHRNSYSRISKSIWSSLVYLIPASLFGSIGLWFMSSTISSLMGGNELTQQSIEMFAFIVPFIVFIKIFCSILRGTGKVLWAQFIDGLSITFFASITLAIFMNTNSALLPVYSFSSGAIFAFCMASILILPLIKVLPSTKLLIVSLKKHLSTGIPSMIAIFTLLVTEWIYLFFLANYSTIEDVGYFRVSWQISMLIAFVTVAADAILSPKVATLFAQNEINLLSSVLNKIVIFYFIISTTLLLLVGLFAEFILSLFGEDFTQAKPTLILLCIYQGIAGTLGIGGKVMVMTGYEKTELMISAVTLCIVVALSAIFIPIYGSLGASAIAASTMLARCVITSYFVKNKLKIDFIWNFKINRSSI